MNELQKKIYDYFDCDSELKVLFIFQNISVPLKWGELNINQIAPERGDNQVL